MKRLLVLFILVAVGAQVYADDIKKSLCNTGEAVVFSCSTGKKIISVCASENLSANSGYVHYRFGAKEKIELSFPDNQSHPSLYVTSGNLMYSGGGGAYMRFNNGAYSYVVYSGMGKGWDKEGVAVEKNGKLLSNIVCKDTSVGVFGSEFFTANGIPDDKNGFDIP
jgi:hypothetical protein